MVAALCIALVAVLVALAAMVAAMRREQELRRMAQFLRERPQASNARMAVGVRSQGALELAQAVNKKLDEIQHERIENTQRELELQRSLSALSHDIRTPLSAAQGYLQLLEEESDSATRERYAHVVEKRLEDVRQLLDELLLYAKVQDDGWQPVFETVDVTEVLTETLTSFYPQFVEKGWTPHIDLSSEPCLVTTDTEALTRVFHNLIANTLRHGMDAPRIVQRGKTVTVANRMTDGTTLDPDHLFDRFYREDSARATGGSGLGLAIVAELCRALGATIKASSAGNALSIVITLP